MGWAPVNRFLNGRAQAPLTGREIRGGIGGVILVYRRSRGAASCGSGDSVAGIGVNGAVCHIGASNPIPVLVPPLQGSRSFGKCRSAIGETGAKWTVPALEIALCQSAVTGWRECAPKLGIRAVQPSVPVLVLCCRPGRSPGPGRLTTQVGAGDHPGQDAQTAPHRLPLLGGVRRRPAIGRWSPLQLVHLSAVCRDSSDRCSRKRVCTIATRNKTSHSSAQRCGPLQAITPWLCAGMRGAISSLFFGPFHAILGVYRNLSSVTERPES